MEGVYGIGLDDDVSVTDQSIVPFPLEMFDASYDDPCEELGEDHDQQMGLGFRALGQENMMAQEVTLSAQGINGRTSGRSPPLRASVLWSTDDDEDSAAEVAAEDLASVPEVPTRPPPEEYLDLQSYHCGTTRTALSMDDDQWTIADDETILPTLETLLNMGGEQQTPTWEDQTSSNAEAESPEHIFVSQLLEHARTPQAAPETPTTTTLFSQSSSSASNISIMYDLTLTSDEEDIEDEVYEIVSPCARKGARATSPIEIG